MSHGRDFRRAIDRLAADLTRIAERAIAIEIERAIALDPNCSISQYNLGNIRQARGGFDAARLCYARAIELAPTFAKAHWNKALCHLSAGEFADGWREFAWRAAAGEVTIDHYPQALWEGQPLTGKTILVHAEQGIGDEILFATCFPDLIALAGRVVIWACSRALCAGRKARSTCSWSALCKVASWVATCSANALGSAGAYSGAPSIYSITK